MQRRCESIWTGCAGVRVIVAAVSVPQLVVRHTHTLTHIRACTHGTTLLLMCPHIFIRVTNARPGYLPLRCPRAETICMHMRDFAEPTRIHSNRSFFPFAIHIRRSILRSLVHGPKTELVRTWEKKATYVFVVIVLDKCVLEFSRGTKILIRNGESEFPTSTLYLPRYIFLQTYKIVCITFHTSKFTFVL